MFKYRKRLFISLLMGLTFFSSFAEATVPNAPGSDVGVSKLSNTSVRISTKDNSNNEDGFYALIYDYKTSELVQKKEISSSNNSYVYADFTNLVCDKLYSTNVLAFNEDGNSSVSNTRHFNIHSTFSTPCSVYTPAKDSPATPGPYIGVSDIDKNSVRVNFLDNANNENGFLLFDNSGDINVTVSKNNKTAPSQTSVILTGLRCNKTYTIKALAFNSNGNSATSNERAFNIQSTFGVTCDDTPEKPVLTKEEPLVPANCLGHITKSGVDTNGNGVLDADEVTSSEEHYDEGTPITREALMIMIGNGDNVTQVNTCKITDMSHLFNGSDFRSPYPIAQRGTVRNFNQDIRGWNTGSVTNMSGMFRGTIAFNQPLDSWDVSSVTNMDAVFASTEAFNQPLNSWNVSSVTNMNWMFSDTKTFNQLLDNWDVSNVTSMRYMFSWAVDFNQPLARWDVSNVTNMEGMFWKTRAFNQPLDSWDVSSVTNMHAMFNRAIAFNQPLNGWDVSHVTDMNGMFSTAIAFPRSFETSVFNQPLDNWDVSSVTHMNWMFYGAKVFNKDISNWDVTNVIKHDHFADVSALENAHNPFYEEAIDTTKPIITLLGDATVTLTVGDTYTDAGATATDDVDGNITSSIQVTGLPINTSSEGNHTITYSVSDAAGNIADMVTRKVIVNSLPDTTKPVITLLGDATVTLTVGDSYTDAGATAIDNKDGNITANIQVTGLPIDTSSEGNHTITYSVSDAAGNVADVVTREVRVVLSHNLLTKDEPLVPANCLGHIRKSGIDTNGNGVLDADEVTSSEEHYDEGTPITRETLMTMIGNGDDVTQVNTCKITDMNSLFSAYAYPKAQRETVKKFNQDISGWNTGSVTNMSYMFIGASAFNQPLESWDVSSVTNMSYMFFSASAFNQPLNNWDVSNVTDMSYMFISASVFNQPLESWDVSSVTNMSYMFPKASAFNQALNNWDVSSVTSMSGMFYSALAFNQPLNNWNVSSVTNMGGMFHGAKAFNQPLEKWNVSNVTDMNGMFYESTSFNQPLNSWDISSVTSMGGMFVRAVAFNQPLNSWNVSSVTDMSYMFSNAEAFNQPLNSWNVSSVTDMSGMFSGAKVFNQSLDSWDVSNVTNMGGMFGITEAFNQPLDSWDVSNVTNMGGMFHGAKAFNQPLDSWDVSNVTNIGGMFTNTIVFNQPLNSWNVSSVTTMYEVFRNSKAFNQPLNSWDVSNVINMSFMFYNSAVFNQNISNWDVSNVEDHKYFAYSSVLEDVHNPFYANEGGGSCDEATAITREALMEKIGNGEDVTQVNTCKITDMSRLFYAFAYPEAQRETVKNFNQDISGWNTESVTNMRRMFRDAKAFNQPINSWNVSNVTNMGGMFTNAIVFNQPIDSWDVSSVTDMFGIFLGAKAFNQPIDSWDVSSVTNMRYMFWNAKAFNQPLDSWNVSSVTNMRGMFYSAVSFNQPLDSWDVSSVTTMYYMFYRATAFNQPLDSWNVSSVTDMHYMFRNAVAFNQPLDSWDVSSVTDMNKMFYSASAFSNHDLSSWSVTNVTNHDNFATGWGSGNTEPNWN